MGRIKSGILSKVSGRVGKVVGSSWNGVEYIKSIPTQYKDAKTEEQIWYRSKFSSLMRFMQIFTEAVQVGFKADAVSQSAYNAAASYNYHHAMPGDFPEVSIDLSKVLLSKGQLFGATNAVASSNSAATLRVTWSDDSGMKWSQSTDDVMIVVYHPELEDSWINLRAAARADTTTDLVLPQAYSGAEVHVYLSFLAKQGKNKGKVKGISNSIYLGEITII